MDELWSEKIKIRCCRQSQSGRVSDKRVRKLTVGKEERVE